MTLEWKRKTFFPRRTVLLLAGFILLCPAPIQAQSKAQAPVLDAALRQVIAAMTPLTDRSVAPLRNRVVVITFFASWCPPCRPEFGHLNAVREAFPEDKLTMLAINLFEDFFAKGKDRRMARFLETTGPGFAVLRARDDATVERAFGGVDRIPTVYVYDRTGKPAYTFIHQKDATKTHVTQAELMPVLRRLIE